MTIIFSPPPKHWVCPNCTTTEITAWDVANRFHECRGLKGLTAPLVIEGTKCKVHAIEREDYVGTALATHDGDGRATMAVETVREDGNDVAAFADCATTRADQ